MNVSVEKLENGMAKLTIEVEPEQFEEAIERAYNKQKGRINIPGFRKGKAPRNVIEKLYGAAVFYHSGKPPRNSAAAHPVHSLLNAGVASAIPDR